MVSSTQDLIDTKHEGTLIDFKYDYYGTKLATTSADGSIQVFENNSMVSHFSAHQGPVLSVSWSHPKYGSLLASGGSDQRVVIWKETSNKWAVIYDYLGHSAPISAVSWSPEVLGLVLGVTSMDGCISVLFLQSEDKWQVVTFHAHPNGVLNLAWNPFRESILTENEARVQFASSGTDGAVRVWTLENQEFHSEELLKHKAWVRGIIWDEDLVSGCEDGYLVVWRKGRTGWKGIEIDVKSGICGLSVNECGGQLAVSCVNGETKIFGKEGEWKYLYRVEESKDRNG